MNLKEIFFPSSYDYSSIINNHNKNLKSELTKLKEGMNEEYVIFYNDGTIKEITKKELMEIEKKYFNKFFSISYGFSDSFKYYVDEIDFDSLNMNLLVGIIYNKKELNEDYSLKDKSKAVYAKVHYITTTIDAIKNGEKVNFESYGQKNSYNRGEGIINYSNLVKESFNEGINYNGPADYKELQEKINNKESFDINLSLDLEPEKTLTLKK